MTSTYQLIAVLTDPRTPLNSFSYIADGDEVVVVELIKPQPVRYKPYRITATQEAQIQVQKAERLGWEVTWAEGQEPA